jgi:nucleoside 2-deoxyribosyltransferase
MKAASLIVADLSLERPSCYYELGVAQALGRPTFLLAVTGTAIHQVADRDRIHFYADLKELSVMMDTALTEHSA